MLEAASDCALDSLCDCEADFTAADWGLLPAAEDSALDWDSDCILEETFDLFSVLGGASDSMAKATWAKISSSLSSSCSVSELPSVARILVLGLI